MKSRRRTTTIVLWLVSIGLVVGMIITFTPTLGGFGRGAQDGSGVALRVNGSAISELALARARATPLYNLVSEGEVAEDLEHLLVDELVRQELVRQEAARQRVTEAEVRQAVDQFRESRGVAGRRNDQQYLQILASAGFTDQSFRDLLRQQLRQEKWEAELIAGVEVSDEEVQAYYESNRDLYSDEERIIGRQLVFQTREEAEGARLELVAGADAAVLARERSIERADRDGALGAPAGETEPRPVGRPALPTAVATAAFALRDGGITEVIAATEAFHIVVVDEYLAPAPRPFDEVGEAVREDALEAKIAGVVDEELARLEREATVEVPAGSPITYRNVPLARVGEVEITRSDLVRATYSNPQIQQALSPETAFIVTAFFKPSVLDQLIDQELAYQGAADLGVAFVGPRRFIAQTALTYVARDAAVDEEEVLGFYEENQAQYTIPAHADVVRVTLPDVAAAEAFRADLLAGAEVDEAADVHGGELVALGRVERGELESQLDQALFETDAFHPLPDSVLEVSDVLVVVDESAALPGELLDEAEGPAVEDAADAPAVEDAADAPAIEDAPDAPAVEDAAPEESAPPTETVVVLVATRTPAELRPLEEVRAQIESTLLAEQRAQLRGDWLSELRERIEVQEFVTVAPGLDPATTFVAPPGPEEEAVEPVPGEAEVAPDPEPTPAEEPGEPTPAEPHEAPDPEPAEEPAGDETAPADDDPPAAND